MRQHRSSFPADNRVESRKRRPSTIAEQAILRLGPNKQPQVIGIKLFGQSVESAMSQQSAQQDLLGDFDVQGQNVSGCLQDFVSQPCSKTLQTMSGHMITTSIDEGVEADIMDCHDEIIRHKGQTFVKDGFGIGLIPSSAFGDFSQLSNTSIASLGTSSGGSPFTSFDSSLEADLVSSRSGIVGAGQNMGNGLYPTSTAPMAPVTGVPNSLQVLGGNPQNCNTEQVVYDRSQNTSPVDFREGRRASDGLMAQGIIAFRQRLKESMRSPGISDMRTDQQTYQTAYGIRMAPSNLLHDYTEENDLNMGQFTGDESQSSKQRPRPLMKRMSLPSETFDMQPHRILALKQSLQVEQQMDRVVSHDSSQQPLFGESSKPLQQQLLQHRLQQKRQSFHQKHAGSPQLLQQLQQLQLDNPNAVYPCPSSQSTSVNDSTNQHFLYQNSVNVSHNNALVHTQIGDSSLAGQTQVIRKTSYKMAQQQPVLPEYQDSELLPWQRAVIESQESENVGGMTENVCDYNSLGFNQTVTPQCQTQYGDQGVSNVNFESFGLGTPRMEGFCGVANQQQQQGFSLDDYVDQEGSLGVPVQQQPYTNKDFSLTTPLPQYQDNSYTYMGYPIASGSQQPTFNMTVGMDENAMDIS